MAIDFSRKKSSRIVEAIGPEPDLGCFCGEPKEDYAFKAVREGRFAAFRYKANAMPRRPVPNNKRDLGSGTGSSSGSGAGPMKV
jgi:hypothetical protein